MRKKLPTSRKIIFQIKRYNPDKGSKAYWQDFTVNVKTGMTVLDGLHEIKESQDSSLSMRYSCRMGICGSCSMLINGKPSLACNTQILEVTDLTLVLAPLTNFDIIKDLVPDLTPMLDKHRSIMPYIRRSDEDELENPTGEYFQSMDELIQYLQFAYCVKCGSCMSVCPTVATDIEYIGPMPLTQAHRYNADTRDDGFAERKQIVGSEKGAFRCHYAGECSRVCPKGVDPAKAIQYLKRFLVMDYLKLFKPKMLSKVVKKAEGKRDHDIPKPPKYTV